MLDDTPPINRGAIFERPCGTKDLCKINFQTAGVIQTYQREEDVRKMWSEKWLFFALLLLEGGGVYYFSAPDISDFIFEDNPNLFSRES